MLEQFAHTWRVLQAEPATWLAVTLLAYAAGMWGYKKSGYKPIFTPLLTAIILVVGILLATRTGYNTYFEGGRYINFLLGPARVALTVPLYEQRQRLAKLAVPLFCGLVAGGSVAIISAVLIAGALGASTETMVSLAPKSVTVPIAVSISEHLGGIAPLTAALVVITGVVGALLCKPIFALMGEKSDATRGFSVGLAAHGLGTSAAFQINRDTGAFSGLAMGLNGLFTAFAAPVLLPILLKFFE